MGEDDRFTIPRDADPVRELTGMPESQGMVDSYRATLNERIAYCTKQMKIHNDAVKFWASEREVCENFLSKDMSGDGTVSGWAETAPGESIVVPRSGR